jgi:hypothetical protein
MYMRIQEFELYKRHSPHNYALMLNLNPRGLITSYAKPRLNITNFLMLAE